MKPPPAGPRTTLRRALLALALLVALAGAAGTVVLGAHVFCPRSSGYDACAQNPLCSAGTLFGDRDYDGPIWYCVSRFTGE